MGRKGPPTEKDSPRFALTLAQQPDQDERTGAAAQTRPILEQAWGGEEFVVLLPRTNLTQATAVAERIRAAVEARPIDHGGDHFDVTVSIGVATGPSPGLHDTLQVADSRVYAAKAGGRNRVIATDSR